MESPQDHKLSAQVPSARLAHRVRPPPRPLTISGKEYTCSDGRSCVRVCGSCRHEHLQDLLFGRADSITCVHATLQNHLIDPLP